jgi:histidyl-tRNA synthetase
MIFEHEIPSKSKLYFGESAKIKRQIENSCATLLEAKGFEEIVTPIFSYHQHASFEDAKSLVQLHDEHNNMVTLRADSTADVVRIVTKRIGRSIASTKWFYIQPAVSFPTEEQYQVGAEVFDGRFDEVVNNAVDLVKTLELEAILQISNMQIPLTLHQNYGVPLELLHNTQVEKLLALDFPWMAKLVKMHKVQDLEDLEGIPSDIQSELKLMKGAAENISYNNLVLAPLCYANMRYYESLTFRMFHENETLVRGGLYAIDNVNAVGFAVYTDACINQKMKTIKA